MLIKDAMQLPEAPPVVVNGNAFGYAAPRIEGEYAWYDGESGAEWWTETIDGVRYRRTHKVKPSPR